MWLVYREHDLFHLQVRQIGGLQIIYSWCHLWGVWQKLSNLHHMTCCWPHPSLQQGSDSRTRGSMTILPPWKMTNQRLTRWNSTNTLLVITPATSAPRTQTSRSNCLVAKTIVWATYATSRDPPPRLLIIWIVEVPIWRFPPMTNPLWIYTPPPT